MAGDETGMPLEHKMPKVIAAKGTKKVRQCTSGTKSQITVLACASASGQTIPPMVVLLESTLTVFWLKVKYLQLCMGCLHQAGWTRNCLLIGFYIIFLNMQYSVPVYLVYLLYLPVYLLYQCTYCTRLPVYLYTVSV